MMLFQTRPCVIPGSPYFKYAQTRTSSDAQAVANVLKKTLNHLIKLEANGTPWDK